VAGRSEEISNSGDRGSATGYEHPTPDFSVGATVSGEGRAWCGASFEMT
jgi:hypothetical protein